MAGLRSERPVIPLHHLLVALITLVVFQMLGGITDFIAHGEVFGQRQNLPCCYKMDLKRDFQRRTGGVQQ